MIGELLDNRYRVLKPLGGGGMGEVYLVDNVDSGRREALKILRAQALQHKQFVARFRREARAMNRLSHPNIVTVYDFGQLPDQRFYLAMEHAAGDDVSQVLDELERLPVARAVRVLSQLAEAIDHAHARGVIHRDLKPDNMILVQRYGETDVLKVMDFGIAKIIASDYEETSPTSHGLRCGTPPYMAPEQFGDLADDPRIDIYALGCIGYELLTGAPPFDGTAIELFHAHLNKTPRKPSQVVPAGAIPPALDDVLMRCLAKRPEERFQRGLDVVQALDRVPGHRRKVRSVVRTPKPSDELVEHRTEAEDPVQVTATEVDDPRDEAQSADEEALARSLYQAALGQLAETLLDSGCYEARLVVTVAEVRELQAELERCAREDEQLRHERVETERRGREREALLRFATSELRFDHAPARGAAVASAIADQLSSLRARMNEAARETEDALAAITEREIALAARRAVKDEALHAACTHLDGVIKEVTPRYLGETMVAELAARLREARSAMLRRLHA